MKIKKAVIPAAGLGTRFLPFTKAVPKEMLPVVDTPAIEILVREIVESGIREVLIITNGDKAALKNHFSPAKKLEEMLQKHNKLDLYSITTATNNLADISYVNQNSPDGLADAVYHAKAFTGSEPFAVLLGDDVVHNPARPATGQLAEIFETTGKCVLGVQKVAASELSKYGILRVGADSGFSSHNRFHKVLGVVEKPRDNPPSDLAILGRYVFTAEIYKAIEETKPRVAAGEIYLTDAFDYIVAHHGLVGYEFEGIRYDLGDKLGYLKATVEYGLRNDKLGAGFKKYLQEITKKM